MLETDYKIIKTSAVDFSDQTFQISGPLDNEKLEESIKKIGLIQPLLVQEMPLKTFRIISGFRRYSILRAIHMNEIQVLCYRENQSELALFEVAIQDKVSQRPLNAIEISIIFDKLLKFGIQVDQIIGQYLPLLGMGQHQKIYDLYKPLIRLEPEWQRAVIAEKVSIEMASLMAALTPAERFWFLALINKLNLSKSRQREMWTLFTEIARIKTCTVSELAVLPQVSDIVNDEKLTCAQKTERLKDELWALRYPRYTQTKTEFSKIIKEAKCPPDLYLYPPAYFMGDQFQVSFTFKNEIEYSTRIKFLHDLVQKNIVSRLIHLT
jgi:hypothetical protein